MVYQQKYGSIDGVSRELSFNDLGSVAADMVAALTSDIPTFIRLNQTFGNLASVTWIYSHLRNLLSRFLVDEKKITDEQIEFLASIIVNNHPTMKLTEFMLFENYFLGGRYEEFYGETSYILTITRSLQRFKKELNTLYYQIEREQENAKRNKPTKGISWEQYESRQQEERDFREEVYRCWNNLFLELLDRIGNECEEDRVALNSVLIDGFFNKGKCLSICVTKLQHELLTDDYRHLYVSLIRKHFSELKELDFRYILSTPSEDIDDKTQNKQ